MVRGYAVNRTYLWIFASLFFSFYMYFFYSNVCLWVQNMFAILALNGRTNSAENQLCPDC